MGNRSYANWDKSGQDKEVKTKQITKTVRKSREIYLKEKQKRNIDNE